MLIDLLVFDGVDELDVFGPLAVLGRAAQTLDDCRVRLTTYEPRRDVRGSLGVTIVTDVPFEPGCADVLVVPGGGWVARAQRGAWAECQRGAVVTLLRESAATPLIAGVCTGVMLMAHAGLLDGRRATTHHGATGELSTLGVTVVDQRVVDDGDRLTCGGVTSGIDLALWLVAREFGEALAERIATGIEYRWFHPDGTTR